MIDRRELLVGAVRLLAGGTALFTLSCDGNQVAEVKIRLAGLLSKEAGQIGKLWLNLHPEERSHRLLTERILGDTLVDDRLGTAIASRVAADYAAGRTVQLSGWVLSETVGRLCALSWLTR